MAKKRVGIIFGGKSAEHEISIRSAKNVAEALDTSKFEPVLMGIDKKGVWHLSEELGKIGSNENSISLPAGSRGEIVSRENNASTTSKGLGSIDVAFPILHGPYGEDGTVQGLLKLAGIPFVGTSVLGSAVGMDKDIMKRLLRDAGIPIGKYFAFKTGDTINFEKVSKELKLPVFIKPANMGSSVGVSKASTKPEFEEGVKEAFRFDSKILVEANIPGREIECAVLGNENPIASVPGEIITNKAHDFYSYDAKYIDENGAALQIPAKLSPKETKQIQDTALKTFRALEAEGLSRIDSFLTKEGKVVVNEINTMPGFTSISMYPKLFEASGISYSELITKLIELAEARFQKEQKLQTSYDGNS